MEIETVTIAEAREMLGVSSAWLYRLVAAGRIRIVEGGRRGFGAHTELLRSDVLKEVARRNTLLEGRLRKMKGESL